MKRIIENMLNGGTIAKDKIKYDSRAVVPGDIFIAVKGVAKDGNIFIGDAFSKGAAFVICDNPRAEDVRSAGDRLITVEDTSITSGEIMKKIYGDPSSALFLCGITGTNGKTTTVFLVDHILKTSGENSGFISTVFVNSKDKKLLRSKMTTPDILSLYGYLDEMINNGKTSAVIEVSSHALSQKRIAGLSLDSAVFTNISPEHLDYHSDMGNYLRDKMRIFDYIKPGGISALNIDDDIIAGIQQGKVSGRVTTFALDRDADVTARCISRLSEGMRISIVSKGRFEIDNVLVRMPGRHNLYNVLAAVAALSGRDIDPSVIKKGIETFTPVPGRFDLVPSKAGFRVFIDYAHTPGALENILKCARSICKGRLICVFGCGGDRDRSKRPVMGRIASELSDMVVLTSDNPRSEDPDAILSEIENGIALSNNYCIIKDRRQAIKEAINRARKDDIVLIAGKGHEDYQLIGDKVLPFDDKLVAKKALSELYC